jgi:hypothetical protein
MHIQFDNQTICQNIVKLFVMAPHDHFKQVSKWKKNQHTHSKKEYITQ